LALAETIIGAYLLKATRLAASLLTKNCSTFLLPGMNVHVNSMRHHWWSAMPNLPLLFGVAPSDLYRSMCNFSKPLGRPESNVDLPFADLWYLWLTSVRFAWKRLC
jgi:hypothetical protein